MAYPIINVTSEWQEAERWSDVAPSENQYSQNAEWRLLVRSVENAASNTSTVYFKIEKSQANAGRVENQYSKYMSIAGTDAVGDEHNATMTWVYGLNTSTSWSGVTGDASDMYWSSVDHDADGSLTVSAHITGDRLFASYDIDTYVDLTFPSIARNPSAPTSCTANAGNGSMAAVGETVTVTWSGASGVITGYDLQYQIDGGSWTDGITTTSTSFSSPLSNSFKSGQTLKYRIRAKNGSLTSSWKESNTLTVSGGVDIKDSGTWKKGSVWIKVNGAWKRAKRVWIKVNGTWVQSK